ncbi:hypothetical protein ABK040_014921 [Willaertia magna]
MSSFYEFEAKDGEGNVTSMNNYKGKVVMVVNVASKCGYTPQYEPLQKLYEQYKDQGLEILAFPCNQFAGQEPGDNNEICTFARNKYKITFKIFEKIKVNGDEAHPLYKYLKKEGKGFLTDAVKWNFTKFLIDRNGNVFHRYAPTTNPSDMEEDIKKLLNQQ